MGIVIDPTIWICIRIGRIPIVGCMIMQHTACFDHGTYSIIEWPWHIQRIYQALYLYHAWLTVFFAPLLVRVLFLYLGDHHSDKVCQPINPIDPLIRSLRPWIIIPESSLNQTHQPPPIRSPSDLSRGLYRLTPLLARARWAKREDDTMLGEGIVGCIVTNPASKNVENTWGKPPR